jgi:glucose dehydrogenase
MTKMIGMIDASVARKWLLGAAVLAAGMVQAAPVEWPGYNRTLTSDRFVPLEEISGQTVQGLKVLCAYDTHETTAFQSGLLEVNGSLYWTTEHDTFGLTFLQRPTEARQVAWRPQRLMHQLAPSM